MANRTYYDAPLDQTEGPEVMDTRRPLPPRLPDTPRSRRKDPIAPRTR